MLLYTQLLLRYESDNPRASHPYSIYCERLSAEHDSVVYVIAQRGTASVGVRYVRSNICSLAMNKNL